MQENAAFGPTSHGLKFAIKLTPVSGWFDVGPFAVGVSLVAIGLRTVTAVVMVIIPQNVTKKTD